MARRKQSAFEDLIEIAAMMPWWAGLALAVGTYLFLHPIAVREIVVTGDPKLMGSAMTAQIWKSLAMFGQYVLPMALVAGAGLSAFKQFKRNRLMTQTQERGKQSALLEMSWHEFETLVGEAFRRRGYTVVETGGNGPDGGVDLVLRKGSELHLVQCKQWKAYKVGVEVVRSLYGVMAARGAAGGFVVTTGHFTEDARAFAEGQNIQLIEGEQLLAMIQGAKAAAAKPAASATPAPKTASSPACPRCGSPMVRRVAKQGANAGQPFWGCTAYPKCRGTVSIEEVGAAN